MAMYRKPPMEVSGFSGQLGGLVFKSVNGVDYVSRPPARHTVFSPAQLIQQIRFGATSHLGSPIFPMVKEGFENSKSKYGSESNAFFKRNFQKVTYNPTSQTVEIDYASLRVSEGSLINVGNPTAIQGTGHSIDFAWTDNSHSSRDASSEDTVMISLFCPEMDEANNDVSSYIRSNEECTINYPASWVGKDAYFYFATKSPDGKLIGNSSVILLEDLE